MAITDTHISRPMTPKGPGFSLFALVGLARQRRQLGKLDAHILEDIGIDAKEAAAEARRPIWDVPQNWRG